MALIFFSLWDINIKLREKILEEGRYKVGYRTDTDTGQIQSGTTSK